METCTIRLHSARSAEGRVIWPEVQFPKGRRAETKEELARILGEDVRIEWALVTGSGIRTPLAPDDPRIGDKGFLLRIPERDARAGYKAECSLIIDEP